MSAPYRIKRRALTKVGHAPGEDAKGYLDLLMRVIPGEMLGLYLFGYGLIPKDMAVARIAWFGCCLALLVAVRIFGTKDGPAGLPPQPVPVAVSAVAFVVWVYATGGPFEDMHIAVGWVGSLLVAVTVFVISNFVRGDVMSTEEEAEEDEGERTRRRRPPQRGSR
ncbi:hypothetical protein [Streptomyces mirabilis]|uniref:hypothetical protein n=1 Tax=Streptomyces mirabilis TaxID=68239 RepID=UPI0036A335B6